MASDSSDTHGHDGVEPSLGGTVGESKAMGDGQAPRSALDEGWDDDPANALNFSVTKKALMMLTPSLQALTVTFATSVVAPGGQRDKHTPSSSTLIF
jgi:hypothetical protein